MGGYCGHQQSQQAGAMQTCFLKRALFWFVQAPLGALTAMTLQGGTAEGEFLPGTLAPEEGHRCQRQRFTT
jgi:hypothetical protein